MNSKQKARWEKQRAGGMWWYVARYTAMSILTLAVIWLVFDKLLGIEAIGPTIRNLILVSPFTALVTWWLLENDYRQSETPDLNTDRE